MHNSKPYWTLSYIASTFTGCISISAFSSSVGIPIGITTSATGLKFCPIAAGIKKYKSIIKKKKKKHDNIVSLRKSNLNNIKVLIFKALVDAVISHDEFIWINNVRKEYNDMKEEIKFKDCNSSSKILVYL